MAIEKMKARDLLALVPKHSLLHACEPDQLDELLERTQVEFAAKNQVLMRQGEEGETATIIVTGNARVTMVTSNGREIVLDYVGPGAFVGEIAMLDGSERTATVTMVEDGSVLRLTRSICADFLTRYPAVAIGMLQEMARRIRQMNATVESDRAYAAGPRLARYLQRLTDAEAAGQKLRIDISQSELGRFVGISRENINRQLSAWADSGVIDLDHGRIRILDAAALWDIAAIED